MPDSIQVYLTLKGLDPNDVQKTSDRELEQIRQRLQTEPKKIGREAQDAYERTMARLMDVRPFGAVGALDLPTPEEAAAATRTQRAAEKELADKVAHNAAVNARRHAEREARELEEDA